MDRSAQNPGFFVSGGQVFLSSFLGSLSRRVNSGSPEPRTAQCSLRVSGSLQPRGRWARSGSQQSAGYWGCPTREHFACDAVSSGGRQFAGVGDDVEPSVRASHVLCDDGSSGNQQLADVAGFAGLQQSSPRAVAVERGHFDGRAGRHGEEQRAPGGWRAPRPLPGALRQVRNFHRCVSENLTSLSSSLVPHARFSLHPSFVSQNSSLSHGSGAMNSCGSMHGLCMHDNSLILHENSWGALGHKNSCSAHAAGVRGGIKATSTSTRIKGRRSAVEKLASPQQTSSKLHVEVWEGLLSNQGMKFSQEEEIVTGCVVSGARPSCLDGSPEPPGPGRVIRNMFGWSQLEKTVRSGVWLFRGALRGENLFSSLCAAGDWVKKGSYHTAWSVPW